MATILVILEIAKGKIVGHSRECLTAAKELANQMGAEIYGVMLGDGISGLADSALKLGVPKVYKIDSADLKGINILYHVRALSQLINEVAPEVVMAGASLYGQEMMPRLAARFDTFLMAGMKSLAKEGDALAGQRPLFEEKLFGTIQADASKRVFATILSGNFPEVEPDDSLSGEVIDFSFSLEEEDKREEFVEERIAEVSVDITKAKLIISGGRGVGSKEKFPLIFETAKALGGEVGASRAAVDADWVAYDHEVGQTGKIVTPDFYVACGISGAMQHLVGMRNAKIIIAVNTDEEAPILEVAHYAIIADLHAVLPELIKQV
ncbi:MAG: electron transfer flavoprotein subunit alpha/FixB family protein [Candidatus Hodarchaeales archaeon]|jgi:electron transfer flavoprotein alpha subunit